MFIEVDGLRIFYEVEGVGETVVLLHGWGGQAVSFKPVFDYLVSGYKAYALDLPGFGSSDLPPCPWGADDYALFVSAFFTKLGVSKASIIAHSFGGRIAIVLAAKHPEKVNKLILVDSAGIKPRRTLKYHVRVSIAKIGRLLFRGDCLENTAKKSGTLFLGWLDLRIIKMQVKCEGHLLKSLMKI